MAEEATFIDPFLLTVTLVVTVVLVIGNLYFLAYYSHHADNGFGSSAACKFVVVSQNLKIPETLDHFLFPFSFCHISWQSARS